MSKAIGYGFQNFNYAVVSEDNFHFLAISHSEGVVLYEVDCPQHAVQQATGNIVKEWTLSHCSCICYFKRRKLLAVFTSFKKLILIHVESGELQVLPITLDFALTHQTKICAVTNCIENEQKQNAIPFAETNCIALQCDEKLHLVFLKWKDQVQVSSLTYQKITSMLFLGNKLWVVGDNTLRAFIVDLEKQQSIEVWRRRESDKHFHELTLCGNEGFVAIEHYSLYMYDINGVAKWAVKNISGGPFTSCIFWEGHLVLPSHHSCSFVDLNGNDFHTSSNCSYLEYIKQFIWRNVLFLVKDSGPVEARSNYNWWRCKRQVWIGAKKNNPQKCHLAKLPREIIRYILSFLPRPGKLSAKDFSPAKPPTFKPISYQVHSFQK